MPAAQQNGLDGRRVAQLVALLDSPVDAEAACALHRLRVLKKTHGDVPFYELIERPDYKAAVWQQFGNPECLKEQMEAGALIEMLRQDKTQLERDGAALAHVIRRQEGEISDLRKRSTARQAAQMCGVSGPAGEYVCGLFAFVTVMIAAALLFVAACHLAAAVFGG